MKNEKKMLDVFNVGVNINHGKRILNNLLSKLMDLHDSVEEVPFSLDNIDIPDECDTFNEVLSYNDVSVFGDNDESLWTSLFLRCLAISEHTLDPIKANYMSGNYILTSYELGKAINMCSEICEDMLCLVISHKEYITDEDTFSVFTEFARFVKYMRLLDKAIGVRYLKQIAV